MNKAKNKANDAALRALYDLIRSCSIYEDAATACGISKLEFDQARILSFDVWARMVKVEPSACQSIESLEAMQIAKNQKRNAGLRAGCNSVLLSPRLPLEIKIRAIKLLYKSQGWKSPTNPAKAVELYLRACDGVDSGDEASDELANYAAAEGLLGID